MGRSRSAGAARRSRSPARAAPSGGRASRCRRPSRRRGGRSRARRRRGPSACGRSGSRPRWRRGGRSASGPAAPGGAGAAHAGVPGRRTGRRVRSCPRTPAGSPRRRATRARAPAGGPAGRARARAGLSAHPASALSPYAAVESYIAPWATLPALARLAAVEAALPADAAFALERAARCAREHGRRLDEDCLQLYAGTNVPSPLVAALQDAALAAQPSMGYPGAKYQAGLEPLDIVEVAAATAVGRLMGAAFAEVRPPSATLANLAVCTALTEPGDTIAVLPDGAGGRLGHHAVGVASVRGLRVAPLPYDAERLDVDLDALDAFLRWEIPRLVVVGASLMLFPHRITELAEVV